MYNLRLTASDRHDNPEHLAQESVKLLGPLLLDNTAPKLRGLDVKSTPTGFLVKCRAEDTHSAVAGARVVLPDGTIERLDPVDRICDSQSESFAAEVDWPREGSPELPKPWQIKIEVRDLGGNLTSQMGAVR